MEDDEEESLNSFTDFGDKNVERVDTEDCVEYRVFFDDLPTGTDEQAHYLNAVCLQIRTLLRAHVDGFIWQHDPFNLRPHVQDALQTSDVPGHLFGRTRFGDDVENEWFVVFLLLKVTEMFRDATVSVIDTDGQFLLIEAADAIPSWLKPETSLNRVFLRRGKLHVIPISYKALTSVQPTLMQALQLLRADGGMAVLRTEASAEVQSLIRERIDGFPRGVLEMNKHHVRVCLPIRLAVALRDSAELISAAVRAFYSRDAHDTKLAKALPEFGTEPRVMTRVRFTRCLYAQLSQQSVHPPPMWPVPPASDADSKALMLGLKITAGMEIVWAKVSASVACGSSVANGTDNEEAWAKFVQQLGAIGYFRAETPGSTLHNKLTAQAREFFIELKRATDQVSEDALLDARLHKLLAQTPALDQFPTVEIPPDDDECWLHIGPEDLDAMLSAKATTRASSQPCAASDIEGNGAGTQQLDELLKGVNTFLKGTSSYEGAETVHQSMVDLDGDKFLELMRSTMGLGLGDEPDGADSGSDIDHTDPLYADLPDSDDDEAATAASTSAVPESAQSKETGSRDSQQQGDYSTNIDMRALMASMDRELSSTHVGKDFEKHPPAAASKRASGPKSGTNDEFQPVDVDLNLVKNMLASFEAQHGLPGPASNLLGSLGIHLPAPQNETEPTAKPAAKPASMPAKDQKMCIIEPDELD